MSMSHTPQVADTNRSPAGFEGLEVELASDRARLLSHPIYGAVRGVDALRVFMQAHVFAVWDFMLLVKRLQRDLTVVTHPWRPPSTPALARFINEVTLAEESDVDADGRPASHLELYLQAMEEVGADQGPMRALLAALGQGGDVRGALARVNAPREVCDFVAATDAWARGGSTLEVAAVFLFGREDVIPDMFQRLLPLCGAGDQPTRTFGYYLERHIALDGDHHGPLGRAALETLAGDDPDAWARAASAARAAIGQRIRLWDGVVARL